MDMKVRYYEKELFEAVENATEVDWVKRSSVGDHPYFTFLDHPDKGDLVLKIPKYSRALEAYCQETGKDYRELFFRHKAEYNYPRFF